MASSDALGPYSRLRALDPTTFIVLALAAVAWLLLLSLADSPWARYFSHGALQQVGSRPWLVMSMGAGWVLMVMAMMLPTTVPLLTAFAGVTGHRPDRIRLVAILVGAYLLVWFATGVVMYVADFGIHQAVGRWGWLAAHLWIISTAALAVAGAFQFTKTKWRCLRQCRTPNSFLRRHWRGSAVGLQSARIGLDHGAYCVGCCWALMLVMFSAGVGNIVWMAGLTLFMVLEKTTRVGKRATYPIGMGLLAGALVTPFAQ